MICEKPIIFLSWCPGTIPALVKIWARNYIELKSVTIKLDVDSHELGICLESMFRH